MLIAQGDEHVHTRVRLDEPTHADDIVDLDRHGALARRDLDLQPGAGAHGCQSSGHDDFTDVYRHTRDPSDDGVDVADRAGGYRDERPVPLVERTARECGAFGISFLATSTRRSSTRFCARVDSITRYTPKVAMPAVISVAARTME